MRGGHKGQALKFAQIAQLYRLVSAVSFMSNMCNLFHIPVSVPRQHGHSINRASNLILARIIQDLF